jgi:hypothetical protein
MSVREFDMVLGNEEGYKQQRFLRGGAMHARIARTVVDPDQYEAARKVLETEVLPRVRQIPGVVAGYWFEPVDGKGLNVIVCKSKEVAAMPVPNAQPGESPAPGVTVESVEIREVIGQI